MNPATTTRRKGLVTLVTPSLNAQSFIEDTLRSVVAQTHPFIEHIVVDGGSTDATVQIVERFADRVRLIVAPGLNQAAAVNLGYTEGHGEYFGFLNADDRLLPEALASAVTALEANPEAAMVYADAEHVDSEGRLLGRYPVAAADIFALSKECVICQPATLMRAKVFEDALPLDERLDFAMDYDLWLRMARAGMQMVHVPEMWAESRMHGASKTISGRHRVYSEVFEVLKTQAGYVPFNWIHAYAGYLTDRKDQFFEPPTGTPLRAVLTLFLGIWTNRRAPRRFLVDYCTEMLKFHGRSA